MITSEHTKGNKWLIYFIFSSSLLFSSQTWPEVKFYDARNTHANYSIQYSKKGKKTQKKKTSLLNNKNTITKLFFFSLYLPKLFRKPLIFLEIQFMLQGGWHDYGKIHLDRVGKVQGLIWLMKRETKQDFLSVILKSWEFTKQ